MRQLEGYLNIPVSLYIMSNNFPGLAIYFVFAIFSITVFRFRRNLLSWKYLVARNMKKTNPSGKGRKSYEPFQKIIKRKKKNYS